MLDDHVEPEVGLDLFHHVSEFGGGYAFDGFVVFAEWHKEIHDALRNSNLLAFLVDVLIVRKVKKNLGVSKVFVLGFRHFWLQRGIDEEN